MISGGFHINELVSHNQHLSGLFLRFGISPGLDRSIQDCCKEHELPLDFVLDLLNVFDQKDYSRLNHFVNYPLSTILDYLRRTHKYYVEQKLPELIVTLSSITNRFFQGNPEIQGLTAFFHRYTSMLLEHIQVEEDTLFPYIERMTEALGNGTKRSSFQKPADFCIQHFVEHHDEEAEDQLCEVRSLLLNLHPSASSISPFRILITKLENFEIDLRIHAMMEDKVLIPKALCMENILAETRPVSAGLS